MITALLLRVLASVAFFGVQERMAYVLEWPEHFYMKSM